LAVLDFGNHGIIRILLSWAYKVKRPVCQVMVTQTKGDRSGRLDMEDSIYKR